MKKLLTLTLGLIFLITCNSYGQYTYCMKHYRVLLKSGDTIEGYAETAFSSGCFGEGHPEFRKNEDVLNALIPKRKWDGIGFYTHIYTYYYVSPVQDSLSRRYYANNVYVAFKDMKEIIYLGEIMESTLADASYDEIVSEDTLWMNAPVVDQYRIGIFDSIVSNVYISGCNFEFYAHADTKEVRDLMAEVRTLDKWLLEYALKEYGEQDNDENYGFELDDEKINYMFKQVEILLNKFDNVKIVVVPDCFD